MNESSSSPREGVASVADDAKETLSLVKKALFQDPKTAAERLRATVTDEHLVRYVRALYKFWTMDRDLSFDADMRLRVGLNALGSLTDIEADEKTGRSGFALDRWTDLPSISDVEIALGRWLVLVDNLAFVCHNRGLMANRNETTLVDSYPTAGSARKRARSDVEGNSDLAATLAYIRARIQSVGMFVKGSLLLRYTDDPAYRPPNLLALETNGLLFDEKTSALYKVRHILLRFAKIYNLGLSDSKSVDAHIMYEVSTRQGYRTRTWKPLKMTEDLAPLKLLFTMMGENPDDAFATEQIVGESDLLGVNQFGSIEERSAAIVGQSATLPPRLSLLTGERNLLHKRNRVKVTLMMFVKALLDFGAAQNLFRQSCMSPELVARNMIVDSFMLPVKAPMRNVNAYDTGIYDGVHNVFYAYKDGNVPEDLCACKYTPCYFDPNWTTCDIDEIRLEPGKPLVHERVLGDQDLTPRQIADVEFMMGRAQTPQGTDEFHAGLVLIGCPGAGKSLLLTMFHAMFPNRYVGVLSGDEAKFGLSCLEDKWVFICNEIARNLSDVGEKILCILSHDFTSLPRKFKDPYLGRVKCNGIISGNRYFKFDVGGNMTRRLVTVYMMNKPPVVVVSLASQIHRELGAFQCRTLRRYYETKINIPRDMDLIDYLDPMFKENRGRTKASINAYQAFLVNCNFIFCDGEDFERRIMQIGGAKERGEITEAEAETLERDAYLSRPYMPEEVFVALFKTYIHQTNAFRVEGCDETEYLPILQENHIYKVAKKNFGSPDFRWLEQKESADGKPSRRSSSVAHLDVDASFPPPDTCRPIAKDACTILVGIGVTNWKSAYILNPPEGSSAAAYLKELRSGADFTLRQLYLPSTVRFPHVEAFKEAQRRQREHNSQ